MIKSKIPLTERLMFLWIIQTKSVDAKLYGLPELGVRTELSVTVCSVLFWVYVEKYSTALGRLN